MRHPHIAARVFHTPLLAAPAKAAAFIMGLGPRITGAEVEVRGAEPTAAANLPARASLLDDRLEDDIRAGRRMPYRAVDGVAVISVTGTLVHRGAWLGQSSGETSYEGLAAQIEAAASDSHVRGVALEIDSFGGEVAGCFSLADQIRRLRDTKPVWAFVSDHAFSAGYAIASQADHIVLPRTGGVGSIGVICMHADYKDQLEMMGVKVTVISAGERKADGNPYEPLPESVRNDLQAEMEQLRLIFAATVAEGRGELLDTEAALATEAASFIGAAAVTVGLADEVANPRDAFERFVAQVNGRAGATATTATRREGSTMSDQTTTPKPKGTATPAQAAPATPPTASESPAAPPVAENPAPAAAAGPGTSGSAADERVRISAILSHPDAKGREDLAQSLAFNSTMSAEEAAVHLKAAPQQAASRSLSASMEAEATELDAPGADADKGAPSMAARMKERFAN